VYVYDLLPKPLRIQIIYIIRDAFGLDKGYGVVESAYKLINDTLCREYGVFQLTAHSQSYADAVFSFLMTEESIERALDVVEKCFMFIVSVERDRDFILLDVLQERMLLKS
jgi:hypothetical protein